ncbi:hypothetical protein AL060_14315 [Pseudomonas syringae pv. rhaphiolepidis]|nr:hypothetical protein AL060_14315 [Pseudomonas syringae pv. rhaphiolepidis]
MRRLVTLSMLSATFWTTIQRLFQSFVRPKPGSSSSILKLLISMLDWLCCRTLAVPFLIFDLILSKGERFRLYFFSPAKIKALRRI